MTPRPSPANERAARLLLRWTARGWLRPIDAAFADFLRREAPQAPGLLLLGAALASHQLGRGHVCLDLAATLADPAETLAIPPPDPDEPVPGDDGESLDAAHPLAGIALDEWLAALAHPALSDPATAGSPLVLHGTRLYLRRYWQHERFLRQAIADRLHAAADATPVATLRQALDILFPAPAGGQFDWQRMACALAIRSRLAIITGGPGTGKTTTVVRLLALLQALALQAPRAAGDAPAALRIRLAAPTGKAAARLNASIAGAVAQLPLAALGDVDALRAAIPTRVSTLHRLLGSRPDTRALRHHAGDPLPLDVLVIDEASMVDLEMMTAVMAALAPHARLVLLGDRDQLASVEAGAVLGELCADAARGRYTPETARWLAQLGGAPLPETLLDANGAPLDQAVVMLRHSHRFAADSGIGRLAAAVNRGDAVQAQALLDAGGADLGRRRLERHDHPAGWQWLIEGDDDHPGLRAWLDRLRTQRPAPDAPPDDRDAWARAVLAAHARLQLLCVLRHGPWGVSGLNQRLASLLHEARLIPAADGWYAGRPVMVTRNDAALGLMNGDIGVTLPIARALPDGRVADALRIAFADAGSPGGVRWVHPLRLTAVQTVHALTVHKAQGSEFDHAVLVLPPEANPLLTRELIYTAITRARRRFTLLESGPPATLSQAIERRVHRASGLRGAHGGIA
jgi:exodeoxyribonuclease V alpha subunit